MRSVKRIHKNAMLVEFRDTLKQRVSQYLDVVPRSRQEHSQSCTVEHSKRMIGHSHQRALNWNAIKIGKLDLKLYLHFRQQCFQAKTRRRRPHALVEVARLLHGNELSRKTGEPGQMRRFGQYTTPLAVPEWQLWHISFWPGLGCTFMKKRLMLCE